MAGYDGCCARFIRRSQATIRMKRSRDDSFRSRRRPIKVHVVEEHHEALEAIYDAIGARRMAFDNICLVHFDAHPDLTLPLDLTPHTVLDPPALYGALSESEGGSAQWILPAVFAGHINKVWWVRPPWSDQMTAGTHRFYIGAQASTGYLRVSSEEPYYVDDRLYCPRGAMAPLPSPSLHQAPRLSMSPILLSPAPAVAVCSSPEPGASPTTAAAAPPPSSSSSPPSPTTAPPPELSSSAAASASSAAAAATTTAIASSPSASPPPPRELHLYISEAQNTVPQGLHCEGDWALDVCLDYFTTRNPFLDQLEEVAGSEARQVVAEFFRGPTFRSQPYAITHAQQIEQEATFSRLLAQLLLTCAHLDPPTPSPATTTIDTTSEANADVAACDTGCVRAMNGDDVSGCTNGSFSTATATPATTSTITATTATSATTPSSGSTSSSSRGAPTAFTTTTNGGNLYVNFLSIDSVQDGLMALYPESQKKVVTSMCKMLRDASPGIRNAVSAMGSHCATLPSHHSTEEEVEELLQGLRESVRALCAAWGPPSLITIARSADEGYTPQDQADGLTKRVLDVIEAAGVGPLEHVSSPV